MKFIYNKQGAFVSINTIYKKINYFFHFYENYFFYIFYLHIALKYDNISKLVFTIKHLYKGFLYKKEKNNQYGYSSNDEKYVPDSPKFVERFSS